MTGLLLFAFVGIALLALFLAFSWRGAPRTLPDSSALSAVNQMVTLEASSFPSPQRLLDDTEYQILLSNPDLNRVAKRFRQDRQELAVLWITSLQTDVKTLWRFRRFLIGLGVRSTFREEVAMLQAFLFSLSFLSAAKLSIHILGPFILTRMIRRARGGVDRLSYATAGLLGRIPAAGWPEVGRNWARTAA
jgi:hypothetical protein